MGRAERRRLEREKSKQKTATYNLTKEQLDKLVEDQIKDRLKAVKKQAMEDAINTAMTLLRSDYSSVRVIRVQFGEGKTSPYFYYMKN